MITFVICIKPSAELNPSVLAAQVASCLAVRDSRVVLGVSESSELVRGVVDENAKARGPARVSYKVLDDKSLYDAWNRSLAFCDSRWTSFLGYGDLIVNSEHFNVAAADARGDAMFSRVVIVSSRSSRIFGRQFRYSVHLLRQTAAFVGAMWDSEFLRRERFDESYVVAGDYEFLLRVGRGLRSTYKPVVSVAMPAGGLSESAVDRARAEVARARRLHIRSSW